MIRSIFGPQKIYLSRWTGKIEKGSELLEDIVKIADNASHNSRWLALCPREDQKSAPKVIRRAE